MVLRRFVVSRGRRDSKSTDASKAGDQPISTAASRSMNSHPTAKLHRAPHQLRLRALSQRNLVERSFNKIKHYRAIATRYDKLARNFLAAVQLVAAIILLN